MNEKKTERLYTAITNIDDTYIEEAQNTRFSKKKFNYRLISGLAAAAVFVLVIVGGMRGEKPALLDEDVFSEEPVEEEAAEDNAFPGEGIMDEMEAPESAEMKDNAENSSQARGYSYMILPLTFADSVEGVTATRDVVFDFDKSSSGDMIITDSYVLNNTSENEVKLTILYPFDDLGESIPIISVNGAEQETDAKITAGSKINSDDELEKYSYTTDSIAYLGSDITVPAGGSVTVSAEMVGTQLIYELATDLGSVIEFTEQKASISESNDIEIVDQNFGFDIDNDVYDVVLNLNEGYYYIEIK